MVTVIGVLLIIMGIFLVISVLMQSSKNHRVSGSIAGGAETFFGKNKGRTIDAMLRKFTAVIAILFVISSLVLTGLSVNEYKQSTETAQTETAETGEAAAPQMSTDENGNIVDENGNIIASKDADGNLVDPEGNVLATADQLAQAEAPAEEAPAEEATPAE